MKKLIFIILFCPSVLFSQWIQQTVPSNIDMVLCIDFINANTGIAGGWEIVSVFEGRALYTTNAGDNWFHAQVPDSCWSLVKAQFVNENTGYIAGAYDLNKNKFDNSSKVHKLPRKFNYPLLQRNHFERIGMTGNYEDYKGMFLKTTNRGQSWFTLDYLPANAYFLTGLCFINQNTGFVSTSLEYGAGFKSAILKTTNGGISWNSLTIQDSIALLNIYTSDGNIINVTGWERHYGNIFEGIVLRSSNGGLSWTKQYNLIRNDISDIHFTNQSTGFVVGGDSTGHGIIYRTTNAGINWSSIYLQGPAANYNGVEFVKGTGIGIAVGIRSTQMYQFESLLISRTSNYGNTWTSHLISDTNNILFSTKIVNENTWFVCGGGGGYGGIIYKTTTGGVGIDPISTEIPNDFSLFQNYPNPFNPVTNIRFDIPRSSYVKLIIYDALGREVAELVNEKLSAGSYEVIWPAPTGDGSGYPSGVYFYQLETDEFRNVRKMVMIK